MNDSDQQLREKIKQRYRTAEQCHKVYLRLCPPPCPLSDRMLKLLGLTSEQYAHILAAVPHTRLPRRSTMPRNQAK